MFSESLIDALLSIYFFITIVILSKNDSRSSDNDLSVHQFLVKPRPPALLVRCSNQGMPLILEPFSNSQLVLRGTKELRDLLGMLLTLL